MERIKELESIIRKANEAYYGLDSTSIMTNHEYDLLVEELRSLDPTNPVLLEIGETYLEEEDDLDFLLKLHPMRSIRPVFNEDEAVSINDLVKRFKVVFMLKADGHSYRAIYKNGRFVRATSRGRDGRKGKNFTPQLSKKLPLFIKEWEDTDLVEIRGEIVMTFEQFAELKNRYPESEFSNPRNSVATLLKESFNEADLDLMTPLIYNVFGDNQDDSLGQRLADLTYLGFDNVIDVYDAIEAVSVDEIPDLLYELKEECGYLTDGVVIRVDSDDVLEELGNDGKYDEGSFALKFGPWASQVYSSIILDIEWSYGRQFITPMAILEPVDTGTGKTVRRLSLQNVRNMQIYNAYPGSRVYFEYVSEINPKLVFPPEGADTTGLSAEEVEEILQRLETERNSLGEVEYEETVGKEVNEDLLSKYDGLDDF